MAQLDNHNRAPITNNVNAFLNIERTFFKPEVKHNITEGDVRSREYGKLLALCLERRGEEVTNILSHFLREELLILLVPGTGIEPVRYWSTEGF